MNGRESVFLDRKINFSQSTIWILGGTEDRNGLSLPWKVSPLPPRTGPWSDQHLWFLFSPSLLVPRTPSCIQWILFLCLLVKSISKETCLVSKKKKKNLKESGFVGTLQSCPWEGGRSQTQVTDQSHQCLPTALSSSTKWWSPCSIHFTHQCSDQQRLCRKCIGGTIWTAKDRWKQKTSGLSSDSFLKPYEKGKNGKNSYTWKQ